MIIIHFCYFYLVLVLFLLTGYVSYAYYVYALITIASRSAPTPIHFIGTCNNSAILDK